jgi:hypothetical protein
MTTPNVTTIGAGGATLNLAFRLNTTNLTKSARMELDQQVVGGPITVNTQIDSNHGTGCLVLSNSSNSFNGLIINSGLVLATGGVGSIGRGTLTVNGGGAIFSNTAPAAIFSMLQSGYNGGLWNGSTGINSTAAAGDPAHLHAVGMMQPATNTTFEGQNLNNAAVAVKYTYYGDANLDGMVDGSDYSRIDNAYLSNQSTPGSFTGWQNGDFNYDGVVNGSDYTLIDNAFNSQGAQIADLLAGASAIATDQIAGGGSGTPSVPEPTTLGLLAMGACGLLGRRRASRRH